jgi:hypothetical protein
MLSPMGPSRRPPLEARAGEPDQRRFGLLLTLLVGLASGGAVGAGCANTDQNLEKQRLLDELDKAGSGKSAQCKPATQEPCYNGPDGTAGRGICKQGSHTCGDDARWGKCAGERRSATASTTTATASSTTGIASLTCGVGACRRTVSACDHATSQTCTPGAKMPTAEICNSIDDDCDGQVALLSLFVHPVTGRYVARDRGPSDPRSARLKLRDLRRDLGVLGILLRTAA